MYDARVSTLVQGKTVALDASSIDQLHVEKSNLRRIRRKVYPEDVSLPRYRHGLCNQP